MLRKFRVDGVFPSKCLAKNPNYSTQKRLKRMLLRPVRHTFSTSLVGANSEVGAGVGIVVATEIMSTGVAGMYSISEM
jgi:hypothetical protein